VILEAVYLRDTKLLGSPYQRTKQLRDTKSLSNPYQAAPLMVTVILEAVYLRDTKLLGSPYLLFQHVHFHVTKNVRNLTLLHSDALHSNVIEALESWVILRSQYQGFKRTPLTMDGGNTLPKSVILPTWAHG
jgi:hypothetical protein